MAESRMPRRKIRVDPPERLGAEDGSAWLQYRLPDDPQTANLFEWWMQSAYDDFVATVPKMLEYGGEGTGPAVDLQLIGENLASLLDMHDAADPMKMELGCWFYMQGKVARLVSDYRQHRMGKPDSWFDASIYAKMARRIQETGQWP